MLAEVLKAHKGQYQNLVPFRPGIDRVIRLDLSGENGELTPEVFGNTPLFSEYIESKIRQSGARYGIGGYLENRKVYARSRVFDATIGHEEPRTLHLGLDIWGEAGTPVMAPYGGIVHSIGNHPEYGNYGATIILQHHLSHHTFFTLYGHLAFSDLTTKTGKEVVGGEVFAHFGMPDENGHWPPHLHFQIIEDLEGYAGDYPGVCTLSRRQYFAANCPDAECMVVWQ